MARPRDTSRRDIFVETRPSARRISDETWEQYREILVRMHVSDNMTREEVKIVMETTHNFYATPRQYTHRFSKWGVKKYKKNKPPARNRGEILVLNENNSDLDDEAPVETPGSSRDTPAESATAKALLTRELLSYDPRLGSAGDRLRYRWLAEMLLILGDAHRSFEIHAALYETDRSIANVIACARTARTETQAIAARVMLNDSIEALLDGDQDKDSWAVFVFDLLLAHTFGIDDTNNGIGQIEQAILDRIDDDQGLPRLKMKLAFREPRLDILAYLYLDSSLDRFNQYTDHSSGDADLDASWVMEQFIAHQPAFRGGLELTPTEPLLEIDSLLSCLTWCRAVLEVLENRRAVALDTNGSDGDQQTGVYAVLCTLWRVWLGFHLPSSPSDHIQRCTDLVPLPAWADNAETQLGISATELLATMACMMVAEVSQPASGSSPYIIALTGAYALQRLSPGDLICRCLTRVLSINLPRMTGPAGLDSFIQPSAAAAGMIRPFRDFVASSLRIADLPELESGVAVFPLTLAEPKVVTYPQATGEPGPIRHA